MPAPVPSCHPVCCSRIGILRFSEPRCEGRSCGQGRCRRPPVPSCSARIGYSAQSPAVVPPAACSVAACSATAESPSLGSSCRVPLYDLPVGGYILLTVIPCRAHLQTSTERQIGFALLFFRFSTIRPLKVLFGYAPPFSYSVARDSLLMLRRTSCT